ncbi:MAG TPA: polyprenyl synthetase family protein [Streptomyces sp.]|nr:polyprenyl synthetase family protein [Streptomyces sp.]
MPGRNAAGPRTPGIATRGETVPTAPPATMAAPRTTVDVTALLERGRMLATPVLRAAVERLAPPMNKVASYHFGWIDAHGRPADGDGGKAVRPALAVLSAEVTGASPETGVPGAVAVELIHNFSLLHDDLMDGDEQRRHRDTVWKVHGAAQAILVGDALFALANEVILENGTAEAARAARRLAAATRALIDGQAQDISYEQRDRVSVEECLEMEGNKTGALIACASSLGAVLGGADDRTADALERYGYHLGLAFQAVDDLLGIWGDPASTGKLAWSDLRQRKKSLPVVAALAADGPASAQLGEILAADARSSDFASFSEDEFAARAALIERAGGRAWAADEARRQHTFAVEALNAVDMPERVRDRFTALADFVVVRKR